MPGIPPCPKPGKLHLVNLNVFLAAPFIIVGICVNEALIFGLRKDWVPLLVVTLTLLTCMVPGFRIWRPVHFWASLTLIIISLLVSLMLVVFIHTENVILHPDVIERPRLDQNGTDCYNNDINGTLTEECWASWVEDVKSGYTLFGSNFALALNTILIRPIPLPES